MRIFTFLLFVSLTLFAQEQTVQEPQTQNELTEDVMSQNATVDLMKKELNMCQTQDGSMEPTIEDFFGCFNQNKSAYVKIEGVDAIAISPDRAVSFSKPKKFIKYDPYLGLYMIAGEGLLPIGQNEERALAIGEWLAGVNKDGNSNIGKFVKLGVFTDSYSANGDKGSVVTGVCCDMYGIAKGGDSFIGNRYLEHMIKYNNLYYGAVNATFVQQNGKVIVSEKDPFKQSPFNISDEVLKLNGVNVNDFREFRETILFAKPNERLLFELLRNGNKISVQSEVQNITSLSGANRTYLESLGINFDSRLVVTRLLKDSIGEQKGLHVGDKLIQLNGKPIRTINELRAEVVKLPRDEKQYLLFERNGFQFFINFEIPKN